MTQWLKQSTAVTVKMGPFLDETDGKTAETGLSISQADIRLSKNGADFAQTNNAAGATHDENGWYDVPLNTTDTNTLGRLKVAIHEAGALPVWQEFMVVPGNVWDALFGADRLQVDTVEISGDSAAADNLEADYDGTGYARSASSIGTVTTVGDKTGYALSAAGVDAVLDEGVEGALTLRQALRLFLSVLVGKSSGGGSTAPAFRDQADSKNRVSATVDANGNRTAVTLDAS